MTYAKHQLDSWIVLTFPLLSNYMHTSGKKVLWKEESHDFHWVDEKVTFGRLVSMASDQIIEVETWKGPTINVKGCLCHSCY